jgi:glycosyltransferase involved in cell wall biosynthesis/2-polyprenyl-3-methyl-5-hydroxy-6-metoxy-1,4-benzoquinol methylase
MQGKKGKTTFGRDDGCFSFSTRPRYAAQNNIHAFETNRPARPSHMTPQTNKKRPVKTCLLCNSTRFYYLFSNADRRVVRCSDCGLVFLNPQPADEELVEISEANQFSPGDSNEKPMSPAEYCLSEIRRYRGPSTGRLVMIGCNGDDLPALVETEGWQVTGIGFSPTACEQLCRRLKDGDVLSGETALSTLPSEQFDLCIVSNVLGLARSPLGFLREIHRVLKPGGTLVIDTPSIDVWQARFLRQKWMEFKADDLVYFDRQTIQTALFITAFREVIVQPGGTDRLMVFSRKAEVRPQQVLSVVVPAFNEAATFTALMESLLQKELPDLRLEIIVVESKSTDGTRELALKYQNHPRVKLVLEDVPQGKGHAVRAGLECATGDYVLIQDADLEYDLEDYDALVEELVSGRHAFVLGSRHGGHNVMKMRQFAGQRGLSLLFNSGHWFFTALINILFLQRLRDPFTMYKVFRRDCLYGLDFECNRFDFDYELLVKLVRKGYSPLELPVNYRSRTYDDGKKVRMFRDPFNWLKVLVWLRWIEIDPMSVVERTRNFAQLRTKENDSGKDSGPAGGGSRTDQQK